MSSRRRLNQRGWVFCYCCRLRYPKIVTTNDLSAPGVQVTNLAPDPQRPPQSLVIFLASPVLVFQPQPCPLSYELVYNLPRLGFRYEFRLFG